VTVKLLVGDTRERIKEIPDGSVDLVACSPPFLALRKYGDDTAEMGSERTPADFLDALLELTGEFRRVLAPHGSIAIELGDVFSGSGGAGGDYADEGWRNGQPKFGGSASRGRESQWSEADALWMAGVIDTEGSVHVHRNDRGGEVVPSFVVWVRVSMMERQICDRAAEIAGVGKVTQDKRGAYTWAVSAQQARYVLLNIWPHLLIKQRQAKAAIELARHIEDTGGRGNYARIGTAEIAYREQIRQYVVGLNARGEDRGVYVPTWDPPTPPKIAHTQRRSIGWPLAKSLTLIPTLYPASLAYGWNMLNPAHTFDRWRVRNVIVWARPNPPVGALGDKVRPATSYITVGCTSAKRWFDLDAVREPHMHPNATHTVGNVASTRGDYGTPDKRIENNPAGAPPLDWWEDEDPTGHATLILPTQPYPGAHYATWPESLAARLIKMMCPLRVCTTCGEPSRRITRTVNAVGKALRWDAHTAEHDASGSGRTDILDINKHAPDRAIVETLGWSGCGHDTWRPGRVLDPFSGSSTTLAVAQGLGRDATGIELYEANAELSRQRVGMYLEIL
jgi:hypothetical protein